MTTSEGPVPTGADLRRGPFRPGDRVQLTDPRGRLHTITLTPGGVLIAYVATTTQLSRLAEDVRDDGRFTEPTAWESMVRGWHLEGLAVRPEHRMIGHTGFLLTTRRMADGVPVPPRRRRPAKGAYGEDWTEDDLGERPVSDKKLRKARREIGRIVALREGDAGEPLEADADAVGHGEGPDPAAD